MMSRFVSLCLVFFALCGSADARPAEWQPTPGHVQLRIWPRVAPDGQRVVGPENDTEICTSPLVGGKSWVYVGDVTEPTITVYPPKGKNTGVAVLVFPGGGYSILAIDLEGTEVCNWLNSQGITAVLLKYRVPGVAYYPKPAPFKDSGPYPKSPIALEDAQRALGMVRYHARTWHIDPSKIGVIGFSAGGHLVAAISTHFDKRIYTPIDAADQVSCRPDFAIALYPGHLWNWNDLDKPPFVLNPDIANRINSRTPPTFIVQAEDDPVDDIDNSLLYYIGLKNAGVPVEMHLYAEGGHAFGLRRTKYPITCWPELVDTWLQTINMVPN